MKKLYILLCAVVSSASFAQTFYSENMGTPSGTTAISANLFQNSAPIVYSGTADVRATTPSSGYNGASAGGNVLINAVDEYFQIDGLNSSAYNTADLQLSFGINTPSNVSNVLVVEVSTDAGANWSPLTYTPTATGWTLATIGGGTIPSAATLSIRFKSTTTSQFRLDDVKLSSVSASCTLSLGVATGVCDGFNFGTDTSTVTLPFTGAGNAVYNVSVSPNFGTIGGDNPSSVAAGNIIISGLAEGSTYTVNITGGTCSFTVAVSTPECKPVNPLPLRESFNYAVGASLGAQESWANINSGDNILVASGSLSYPNAVTIGNSVSFTGAGIDCFSPFTATTSGTVYASFMMNVADMTNITTDLSESYFAALTDANKSFKARMFFKRNGTQYQLGFDAASTTTNYDATLRNIGDVVYVVMGYDFGTNTLSAWLNPDLTTFNASTPATLTSTPATAITELGGFIIRQDADNRTPSMVFDELTVATDITSLLGVKQNNIAGLDVYPNPVTNGMLYINTAANLEKTVVIYDVLGKQILNTTATNSVNIASLKSGLYILKITEAGKTATSKLVIK